MTPTKQQIKTELTKLKEMYGKEVFTKTEKAKDGKVHPEFMIFVVTQYLTLINSAVKLADTSGGIK